MASATYLIGVDTGGTYTDAAVIEAKGHKVVASAKSITTKGDLSIGVSGAVTAAIAASSSGCAAAPGSTARSSASYSAPDRRPAASRINASQRA